MDHLLFSMTVGPADRRDSGNMTQMYESSGGPFSHEISPEISSEISSENIRCTSHLQANNKQNPTCALFISSEISGEISRENGPPELLYRWDIMIHLSHSCLGNDMV